MERAVAGHALWQQAPLDGNRRARRSSTLASSYSTRPGFRCSVIGTAGT